MATVQVMLKKNKQRRNASAFSALLASPATAGFTMPAASRVKFDAPIPSDVVVAGPTPRTFTVSSSLVVDHIERGATVTAESGVTVLVDLGLGKWAKIAEIA